MGSDFLKFDPFFQLLYTTYHVWKYRLNWFFVKFGAILDDKIRYKISDNK